MSEATAAKVMRFRIRVGRHSEGGKLYDANDEKRNLITTTKDLVEMFGPEKFERLPDDDQPGRAFQGDKDRLMSMTVTQLRGLAEEEEIDLSEANNKREIVTTIYRALREREED